VNYVPYLLLTSGVFALCAATLYLLEKNLEKKRVTALQNNSPLSLSISVWGPRIVALIYFLAFSAVLCLLAAISLNSIPSLATISRRDIFKSLALFFFMVGLLSISVSSHYGREHNSLCGQSDPVSVTIRDRAGKIANISDRVQGVSFMFVGVLVLVW
jgi:hypothetical protein